MNIAEILHQRAVMQGDDTAIIDVHRRQTRLTTFSEMEQASAAAAAQLQQTGFRPGEAVLVFQPMSAELYIILAAIFRLGLVAMFLDPGQGRDYIEQCCALHRPRGLIASPKAHLLRLVSREVRQIPHKFVVTGGGSLSRLSELILKTGRRQPEVQNAEIYACPADTPALLTFTSGSTGQPKAALRTHGFLLAQHRVLATNLALTVGQVDLATMPIVALANLASGVTSVVPNADLRYPGAIDPEPVISQMKRHAADSVVASPALLERLTEYCLSREIRLPHLQKIFSGGAPVFPPLLERLQNVAPQAKVVAVYGSTEAEPMAEVAWHQMSETDGQAMRSGQGLLVGTPVNDIRLRVIPDQWGTPLNRYDEAEFYSICCSNGEVGEIVVSGEHVLPGYMFGTGNRETKFQVDDVIWHRTGDAGYLDEQARLWLLGRCIARIEDRRGRLYPFAVECAASYEPFIRRSALIAHRGRRILTVEVTRQVQDAELESVNKRLSWARLDDICIIGKLPVDKRHNAKIDYPALHKLLSKHRSRA